MKSAIGNQQLDFYPCFCLCFTLMQITRTVPLRRTILQFSQILLTLLRTFIVVSPLRRNGQIAANRWLYSLMHFCTSAVHPAFKPF
jgi:hypothetical protein